ncbi:MAG: Mrp/NBP35 family ATP-binding protein [Deltaproteobacteria bacterium]|nr:Mrp/NBP35 family ATP-binding protein [Deltaproteobacteria bacterium]
MPLTKEAVQAALSNVDDPEIGRPLTDLGMIGDIEINGTEVKVAVNLTTPACPMRQKIGDDVSAAVKAAGATAVEIDWGVKQLGRAVEEGDPCPGVKNIVLVVSGKGGVGKSTVAANVAVALSDAGAKVGLLDADMYGPSIPTMFGVSGPVVGDGAGNIKPLERHGIKLMSIGFLLESDKAAVIWRGPMLQGALVQFLNEVRWGELDYLIVDLPPGTGDVALTLSQKVKPSGALLVTTPQAVALADVYKAASMLETVHVPVLGVVENESYFICDGCDKRHELFGSGGGQLIADFAKAPLLGQLPMDPAVREAGDEGTPVMRAAPDSEVSKAIKTVAERLADRVSVATARRPPEPPPDGSGSKKHHLPIAR